MSLLAKLPTQTIGLNKRPLAIARRAQIEL